MGPQVKLMPGNAVVTGNKSGDTADARAIWMAVQQQLVKLCTMQSNGLLAKYGEVMAARWIGR
jgi:hypothetical protein